MIAALQLSDTIVTLTKVSGLLFVVGSMLAMGLSLTIPAIVVAISNVRVLVLALVANFVVVPAVAYGAAHLISSDHQGLRTGLILAGAAAGAPFLPKLVETARGSVPLAVGLMVVLMVVTIVYLPLALPLLLGSGVSVDSWQIAKSLIFLMLLPLGIGLFVRARWRELAAGVQPVAARISTLALAFAMVALLVANFREIVGTVGTRGILGTVIVLAAAFVAGWLIARPEEQRSALALGTAQRNLSAAVVVAAQNFGGQPEVITMVMVVGVLGLLLLFAAAGELGKRRLARTPTLTKDPDEAKRIAEEAYVFCYPLLEFYKSMFGLSLVQKLPTYEGPMNAIANRTKLLDASFTAVISPNNDTLYSMLMCDLRAEPLVLTVPPVPRSRYFSFELIDLFTHVPGFVGTRMGDTGGGTFLLAGPSWDGKTEPPGVTRTIRVETDFLFCLGRTQVDGPDDLDAATALMAQYAVQPLSAVVPGYTRRPVAPLRLSDIPIYDPKKASGIEFVGYANWLLAHVDPNVGDAAALGRYRKVGVAPGAPFFSDALPEEIREAMTAGVESANASIDAAVGSLGKEIDGWKLTRDAFGPRERMQGRWLVRAAAARFGLFGNPDEEASYPVAFVDGDGDALDGARHDYVLHMPKPPVDAFWSVTMYRLPERLFVDNPIGRYSIGDRTPGVVADVDGNVPILIQQEPPDAVTATNWLPAPDGPFYLILRLYLPGPPVLDGTWTPPAVEKADVAAPSTTAPATASAVS